jgi:hypothetical protein
MKNIDAELRRRFERNEERKRERADAALKNACAEAERNHNTNYIQVLWGPTPTMYKSTSGQLGW